MLLHYLKIAFRNMWKYKSQTLISLIGLAVGFTCFALATLWMVYEMTYDSFHKNAKQMYVVYRPDGTIGSSGPFAYSRLTPRPLAAYLKETFPEIADAITLSPPFPGDKVIVEGVEFPAMVIRADTSFLRMFDVSIVEGNRDFLIPGSNKLAITQKKARQLFGNENPIGKMINNGANEICAVVSDMSKQSNYAFDFIRSNSQTGSSDWSALGRENTIIEPFPNTNIKAFEKKLYEHEINNGFVKKNLKIISIKKLRYSDPNIVREVKFQHILIFSLSGFLVILCSLFNYLTLFVNRFRIRQKELALRMMCGATKCSLLMMLSVEFVLTLLISVVLGFTLTQKVHQPFLTLSNIQMDLPAIYRELLMYVGGVVLVSLLAFWMILFVFQRRSLNESIRWINKNLSRKISVAAQLVISIGFAFCTVIILKQMYYLHHTTELGFSFQNRGTLTNSDGDGVLANQLKQMPEIIEVVDMKGLNTILPRGGGIMYVDVDLWDDKPVDAKKINLEKMFVSPESITFYDFQLIAGEMLTESDPESLVLLNESAVKAFGWHEPVGKHFSIPYYGNRTVKGVIKNVYNFAPTVEAKPVVYTKIDSITQSSRQRIGGASTAIVFKYREGMWNSCKEKIEQLLIERRGSNLNYKTIFNTEEEYNDFLKSENALIKLLSFVSAICVLICVFGFVSLVSLTLEERRKSIAIHKINGATSGNILAIFAKEYSLLLLIGSVIALNAGYLIMQRWLEQYVKQTGIPVWIYLSILFVMALVIVLCVGWQVWRASVENPSEVVKKN